MSQSATLLKRLTDLIEIKHGFAFSSQYFGTDGDYVLLTPGNFFEAGGFRDLGSAQKRFSGLPPADFILKKGDVLVAMTEQSPGLLGSTIKVPQSDIYLHNQRLGLLSVKKPERVSLNYLYHAFNAPHVRKEISAGATGTKVKHTSPTKLSAVEVFIPSLVEQERTANLLDEWDTAIQKTEQLIEAKERHYFGLVGRLITGRSKSEPSRHVSIRDIADRVQRQGDGGDYPLLTISSASGFIRQEDRYSRYMAGESAKTYTLLRAGEFSYNKGNSKRYEFGCVFQLQNYEAALVPSVYVSFRLHETVCAAYMRHLFVADYLKPQLRALVKTGVRNNGLLNISPDEFLSTTVPLPPLDQQSQIAKVLDAADANIDLLKQQLAALRTQKRGLMQKLLTGQWRLPIPKENEVPVNG
ncbi:MAG: restriction endonuclease subunit S [Methyloversatilis sp.]|uniref:restriction endonuclease subunit S n=1 Tax=Methyloversatilis sp. TaxID=2569862 RepID=UPI0025F34C91|nr:restriction endonuclease subunit S [Methyloversatilis sp.]MCR6665763.1 restriction endonuclease subunit S [Methyloversatilis sp.]